MEIQMLPIEQLKLDSENPRLEDPELVDRLARNIQEDGLTRPAVVTPEMLVVSGHKMIQALQQLGRTTVPCLVKTFESEKQRKRVNLAQNNLSGKNDIAKLKIFVQDFEVEELKLVGFDAEDLSAALELTDEADGLLDEIHYRDEEKEKITVTFFHGDRASVLEKFRELSDLKGFAWYD